MMLSRSDIREAFETIEQLASSMRLLAKATTAHTEALREQTAALRTRGQQAI